MLLSTAYGMPPGNREAEPGLKVGEGWCWSWDRGLFKAWKPPQVWLSKVIARLLAS